MGRLRCRRGSLVSRGVMGLVVVAWTGRAWGQPVVLVAPPRLPRISAPVILPVVLEGDKLAQGVVASLGRAQIDREGEIAFAATVAVGPVARQGLFAWDGGFPVPLAMEGQAVGGRG